MTTTRRETYSAAVLPWLEPGEQLVHLAQIVPVASAAGVSAGNRSMRQGAAIGNALQQRVGAVSGGAGSIAESFPTGRNGEKLKLLVVTDRRVLFAAGADFVGRQLEVTWAIPRQHVVRVQRRPRFQIMARFRLHFGDGSYVGLMTLHRSSVDAFSNLLTPA